MMDSRQDSRKYFLSDSCVLDGLSNDSFYQVFKRS